MTFKVGDTEDCRINREPARLTWRDQDTLVIELGDARKMEDGNLIRFIAADEDRDGLPAILSR